MCPAFELTPLDNDRGGSDIRNVNTSERFGGSMSLDASPRDVLNISDVEDQYKICRTSQWQLRKAGLLPYRQAAGSRRVIYLRADIESFFESIRKHGKAA
jgi:hypothetical protein